MRICHRQLPSLRDMSHEEAWAAWNEAFDIAFSMKLGVSVTHEAFKSTNTSELLVFQHVLLNSATEATAFGSPVPLDQFLPETLRRKSREARPGAPRPKQEDVAAALAENAWAAAYLTQQTQLAVTEGQIEEPLPDADEVAAVEEAWAAIESARAEWREQPLHGQCEHFVTCFRSGDWNAIHRGINESDRVVAQALPGPPRVWCQTYAFNTMASFSFSRYGEAGCHTMALEWCRRLQYFYNTWRQQEQPKYVYALDELVSYEQTDEWRSFLSHLPVTSAARKRADLIQSLFPTNPSD